MKSLLGAVALFGAFAMGSAHAQNMTRFVVGAPPGGGNDVVARLVASRMNVGTTVVIDNKPGAASMIAADQVAHAPADGSVLLLVSQSVMSVSPRLQHSKTVDPMKDLVPVAFIAKAPLILVAGPALKAQTVPELIRVAKAEQGNLAFGSGGIGTSPHMAGVLFGLATGTGLNHIPYAGEQAAVTDVIGGRVPMMFANAPTALMHIKAGKVRGLGVAGPTRLDLLPNLPTLSEAALPGFDASTWLGIAAPKNTPAATVARLNADIRRVLAIPEIKQQLHAMGYSVSDMTPAQFAQFVGQEDAKWAKVIRDGNIKAE